MRRIETPEHVSEGIKALIALDPRLAAVRAAVGEVALRRREPGFASLVSFITAQQVSRASAEAIYSRLVKLVDPLTAQGFLAAGEEAMRAAGFSRPKQRSLTILANAMVDGTLDLDGLYSLPSDKAMGRLMSVSGVGPWTAEVYLLTCEGHPDMFPAGDVALQSAVAHAFALSSRPDRGALAVMAESWAPWRSVAARLFWAYYAAIRGRDAAPTLSAAVQTR